jgi:Bacterial protein of unknown function (DUF961)
LSLSIP